MSLYYELWTLFFLLLSQAICNRKPPHIVIIVIDDLGWNDVPWNNPDSLAVNLGNHAKSGILLAKHYVHSSCTPSRAALLTGRYAWKMGVQRGNIERYQPLGLSTKYKLLPEYLKTAGYVTHAVGKWHLGYCNKAYLPTRRGFDTFFGMYSDSTHYRSRMVVCDDHDFSRDMIGYDLRRNESITTEYRRRFAPNMYTKEARKIIRKHDQSKPMFLYLPLQSIHSPHVGNAPRRFRHMYDSSSTSGFESSDKMREALLLSVDYAIHKVITDMQDSGMYENSLILVTTDNGGEPWYSNSPLKGAKDTVYEGGIRGAGFLLSPLLNKSGYEHNGLMHIVDWVPTLLDIAGIEIPTDLDGKSMWDSLSNNTSSQRNMIVHNIDEDLYEDTFQAAVTYNNFKLIWGQEFLLERSQFLQGEKIQLYDIDQDKEERSNIAHDYPDIVQEIKSRIMEMKDQYVPARIKRSTKKGWPSNFGGYLSPGWCEAQ